MKLNKRKDSAVFQTENPFCHPPDKSCVMANQHYSSIQAHNFFQMIFQQLFAVSVQTNGGLTQDQKSGFACQDGGYRHRRPSPIEVNLAESW